LCDISRIFHLITVSFDNKKIILRQDAQPIPQAITGFRDLKANRDAARVSKSYKSRITEIDFPLVWQIITFSHVTNIA